jgi:CDP-diacylglycerol--glycerol-3-phosphate 3-phosphatidyltransferase
MERVQKEQGPKSFTDGMRLRFKVPLERIAIMLTRLGLTANRLTVIGLLGSAVAGLLVGLGQVTWGGLVALIMVPFDALDGAVARYQGRVSKFGAFLDSVFDRFAELFLFTGLTVHFLREDNDSGVILSIVAAAGSVMVSYVKARAEGVGYKVNVGLLTRLERMIVLIPALIFNRPEWALWIIAVLANLTAVQRIWHVYRQDANPSHSTSGQ